MRLKSSNPIVVGIGFGVVAGIAILVEPPAATSNYIQDEWRNILYNLVIFLLVSLLFVLFSLSAISDFKKTAAIIPKQHSDGDAQLQPEEAKPHEFIFMSNREEDKNKVVVHIIGGTGLVGRALVRHLARYVERGSFFLFNITH